MGDGGHPSDEEVRAFIQISRVKSFVYQSLLEIHFGILQDKSKLKISSSVQKESIRDLDGDDGPDSDFDDFDRCHPSDDDSDHHHHCCSGDDDDERESAEHDGREEEDSRCNFVFIVIYFIIVFTIIITLLS